MGEVQVPSQGAAANGNGNSKPEEKGWPQEMKLLVAVLGIYGCYLTSGILQEHIYSYKAQDGGRFSQTIFLLWVQCIVNVAFAGGGVLLNGGSGQKMPHRMFSIAGFAYIAAMVGSIEALKYVNFPTKELGKSCKMIPVMLFGVLFAQKRYSVKEYLCVVLITAGIVTFNLGGKHKEGQANSGYGLALLFFSLVMDGVCGSTQDRLKQVCKPTVNEMMFNMNLWALIYLTGAAVVSGQGVSGLNFCLQNHAIFLDLLGFALMAALGQNFIYYTIKNFSPLVCTTITTTRKFFTILFSVIMFGHPMNLSQWGGVAMVFAGIGGEMLNKYTKGKHAKGQKKVR